MSTYPRWFLDNQILSFCLLAKTPIDLHTLTLAILLFRTKRWYPDVQNQEVISWCPETRGDILMSRTKRRYPDVQNQERESFVNCSSQLHMWECSVASRGLWQFQEGPGGLEDSTPFHGDPGGLVSNGAPDTRLVTDGGNSLMLLSGQNSVHSCYWDYWWRKKTKKTNNELHCNGVNPSFLQNKLVNMKKFWYKKDWYSPVLYIGGIWAYMNEYIC